MQGTINITLRLPPELHAQLADLAGARGKSLNREIVERLTYTLKDYNPSESIDLEEIHHRLAALERALFGED